MKSIIDIRKIKAGMRITFKGEVWTVVQVFPTSVDILTKTGVAYCDDLSRINALLPNQNHQQNLRAIDEMTSDEIDVLKLKGMLSSEASHLSQSATDAAYPNQKEIEAYWQSKEGKCLACGCDIAREDSYCVSCEAFLNEVHQ